MKKHYAAYLTLGLLSVVTSAMAQDAASEATEKSAPKLKGWQKQYDSDKDGKLSPTEHAAMVTDLDKNGNGKIDKDEIPKKGPKPGPKPDAQ